MSEDKINSTLKKYNRNFMIAVIAAMVFVGVASSSITANIVRGDANSEVAAVRGVLAQREDNVIKLRDARDEYRDKAFHCEAGYREARTVQKAQKDSVGMLESYINEEVSEAEVKSALSRWEGTRAVHDDMSVLYDDLCLGEK